MRIRQEARFFGWRIFMVGFLLMALVFTPYGNMYGLFIAPLSTAFAVSRTSVVLITTIATVCSIPGAMFFGRFLVNHNIRYTVCILLMCLGLTYLGTTFATSLWQVYCLSAVRGFASAGVSILPISILINNWFGQNLRGRVLGFTLMGSGVGAIILNPVTGHIIQYSGWRMGYGLFAALAFVMIPLVGVTFYRAPGEKGQQMRGDRPKSVETGARPVSGGAAQVIKTPIFWVLMLIAMLLTGVCHIWISSGAPYLSDLGYTTVQVASVYSVSSLGISVAKPTLGVICDKFGFKYAAILSGGLFFAANLLLLFAARWEYIPYIAAFTMGFAMALATICPPFLISDFFGRQNYSVLVGFLQAGNNVGATLMPLAMTGLFDLAGSYRPVWAVACLVSVTIVAAVFFAYGYGEKKKAAGRPAT